MFILIVPYFRTRFELNFNRSLIGQLRWPLNFINIQLKCPADRKRSEGQSEARQVQVQADERSEELELELSELKIGLSVGHELLF